MCENKVSHFLINTAKTRFQLVRNDFFKVCREDKRKGISILKKNKPSHVILSSYVTTEIFVCFITHFWRKVICKIHFYQISKYIVSTEKSTFILDGSFAT